MFTCAVSGCSSTSPAPVKVSVFWALASASAGAAVAAAKAVPESEPPRSENARARASAAASAARARVRVRYERDTGFLQVGSPQTAPPPPWFPPAGELRGELGGELRQAALAVRPRLLVRAVREHAQLLGRGDRVVRGKHRRRRADRV